MLPSFTVENYLKAIFQAQTALAGPDELVPMGQLAAALNVVPGTATTMVKTLAESGLVRYEPYAGVRLTKAGEKLAALVLRRHRLVELFLVNVMGMSWTEVHDEAEALEHAVSDRLIDRIDEMLGRPEVDPHGDPIPNAEGTLQLPAYETLLTCALNAPMRVSRVSDQDREFLEFVERHDLKPGALVEVAERDTAADSVRVKGTREITIGARAASKVLVRAAGAVLMLLSLAVSAAAQQGGANAPVGPFEIADNSFLVEEAFNSPGCRRPTWATKTRSLESPCVSGSAIVRLQPTLHAMLETVGERRRTAGVTRHAAREAVHDLAGSEGGLKPGRSAADRRRRGAVHLERYERPRHGGLLLPVVRAAVQETVGGSPQRWL